MAACFLPVLDYGNADDGDAAATSAAASITTTTTAPHSPAPSSSKRQSVVQTGPTETASTSLSRPRYLPNARGRGRGHGQQARQRSQEQQDDQLKQYAKRRRKAVLLNMLRLLENGAMDAEELQQLVQPMSGEELLQVAEERALAKLCGNPLCGNRFEWPEARWMINGEVLERPEGEAFCSKACRSYIAELARQLGNPMENITPEAITAAVGPKPQQQSEQQRQAQQSRKRTPEVAARGREGPTMLARIQERGPVGLAEEADDEAGLEPAQLMAEVAAADRRYRGGAAQASAVEGYVPRSLPASLAAAAAARSQPVPGAGTGQQQVLRPVSRASSVGGGAAASDKPVGAVEEGAAGGQEGSRHGSSSDLAVVERSADAGATKQGSDQYASTSSGGGSRWSRGRQVGQVSAVSGGMARVAFYDRQAEAGSPRSILKKGKRTPQDKPQQGQQPGGADAASSSRPTQEQGQRRSVHFAETVQYQEYRDVYQRSDTAPQRIDTAQPTVGSVVERIPACHTAPAVASTASSAVEARTSSQQDASTVELTGAAQGPESGEPAVGPPLLRFTLDDPSSVLEMGDDQLGARFGLLEVVNPTAVGPGGADEASEVQAEAAAVPGGMPRALQPCFPPASGGVGVPLQRAATQGAAAHKAASAVAAPATAAALQAVPASSLPSAPAAAAPSSSTREAAQQKGLGSAPDTRTTAVSTALQQDEAAARSSAAASPSAARQPPPERPRKFAPRVAPRRSVVLLDAPPDTAVVTRRRAPAAADTPPHDSAAAAQAGVQGSLQTAAAELQAGDNILLVNPFVAAPTAAEVATVPAQAAATGEQAATGAAADVSSDEEESDDEQSSDTQEWYYDEHGETVQGQQRRSQPQPSRHHEQFPGDDASSSLSDDDSELEGGKGVAGAELESSELEEGDSQDEGAPEAAGFFGAPPKAFRAELSPFGTLWTILHGWVGERTRQYVKGASGAASEEQAGAGGVAEHWQQDGPGGAQHAAQGAVVPSMPQVQTRVALTEAVCAALPDVLPQLRVGVPESEVAKQLAAVVRTFRITGPLPALPQRQWRLLAVLLMRALSSRVPALASLFVGHAPVARLQGLLGSCGFDAAQFAALLDLFDDE